MKILISALGFGDRDNLGGSARVASMNAKALSQFGYEVLFICTNRIDKKTKLFPSTKVISNGNLQIIYVNTITIPFWPGDFGPHFAFFPKWLKSKIKDYDIIHCNEFRSFITLQLSILSKKYNIPLIIQPHGTFLTHGNRVFFKKLYNYYYFNILKCKIDTFIASTSVEKQKIIEIYTNFSKIDIIPNGYNTTNKSFKLDSNFRELYNIDENEYILSVGRLDPLKGFAAVISALKFIEPSIKYIIIGPDQQDYSKVLRKIARTHNVEHRLIFTGGINNQAILKDAMQNALTLIIPSLTEAFGMVIIEGGLAKVPMIISKKCDIVNDLPKDIALIVNPESSEIIAACNKLLKNQNLRQELKENAYKFINETYSLNNTTNRISNLYLEIYDKKNNSSHL